MKIIIAIVSLSLTLAGLIYWGVVTKHPLFSGLMPGPDAIWDLQSAKVSLVVDQPSRAVESTLELNLDRLDLGGEAPVEGAALWLILPTGHLLTNISSTIEGKTSTAITQDSQRERSEGSVSGNSEVHQPLLEHLRATDVGGGIIEVRFDSLKSPLLLTIRTVGYIPANQSQVIVTPALRGSLVRFPNKQPEQSPSPEASPVAIEVGPPGQSGIATRDLSAEELANGMGFALPTPPQPIHLLWTELLPLEDILVARPVLALPKGLTSEGSFSVAYVGPRHESSESEAQSIKILSNHFEATPFAVALNEHPDSPCAEVDALVKAWRWAESQVNGIVYWIPLVNESACDAIYMAATLKVLRSEMLRAGSLVKGPSRIIVDRALLSSIVLNAWTPFLADTGTLLALGDWNRERFEFGSFPRAGLPEGPEIVHTSEVLRVLWGQDQFKADTRLAAGKVLVIK